MAADLQIQVVGDNNYGEIKTPKHVGEKGEPTGVYLEWKNVEFSVDVKDSKTKKVKSKKILKGVSGMARPGELVVVMGPSGAGKSSLLDCLAGRNKQFTGSVTLDNTPWNRQLLKISSYVIQDDLFFEALTVREHLAFQADLRMGSIPNKSQIVDSTLAELGLTKCRDSYIGGSMGIRGISGGERKRLAFASELLTNPRILFADEPTSGLDSVMAETVLIQLRQLARKGRTVLATIHQPSSELFPLFDSLLLVADGALVYHGPAPRAMEYFKSIGFPCPSYSNPTDYFMRQMALTENDGGVSRQRVDTLIESWKDKGSRNFAVFEEKVQTRGIEELLSCLPKAHKNPFTGLMVLGLRNWLRLVRDTVAFKARLGQNLFLGIIVGLIYLQLGNNSNAPQNFSGALFFFTVNQVFSAASVEFIGIPLELPILAREVNGGLYRPFAYYVAKTFSELPIQLTMPWFFITPSFFLIGFGYTATLYFQFVAIILLVSNCATGFGYFISCLTSNAKAASILGPMIILPFLLFGGLFLNDSNAPSFLIWLQYLSPIKYAFSAIMSIFWSQYGDINCTDPGNCRYADGDAVLSGYSMKYSNMGRDIGALLAINIGWRVIAYLLLAARYRKKQTSK